MSYIEYREESVDIVFEEEDVVDGVPREERVSCFDALLEGLKVLEEGQVSCLNIVGLDMFLFVHDGLNLEETLAELEEDL